MPAKAKIVVATCTFCCQDIDGQERVIHSGEYVPASDPIIKGREQLFAPVLEPATPSKPRPKGQAA